MHEHTKLLVFVNEILNLFQSKAELPENNININGKSWNSVAWNEACNRRIEVLT